MDMDRIRGLPIEDFLARLGYSPVWRKRNDLWYNAPYREERTPSFKVNTDRNVWFDFGLGRGGDIFTLAGEFAGSTDFLTQAKYISEAVGGNFVPLPTPRPAKERVSEPAFQEVEQRTLLYGVLKGYLSERGIPSEVAARHCRQVSYRVHEKPYFAIGFQNVSGGWELRSRLFKGCHTAEGYFPRVAAGNADGCLRRVRGILRFSLRHYARTDRRKRRAGA